MLPSVRHSREGGNPVTSEGFCPRTVSAWTPAYAGVTRLAAFGFFLVFLVGCAGSKSNLRLGKSTEGEVVEAEGFAPNEGKILDIKRASLVDAQKAAVEKAVGVFVSARTMVEKAIAIENNILARTEGYVKKYDVISEGPSDGGLYRTRIRALVAIKDLEKDLKDMSLLKTAALMRPRMTVELDEAVDKTASDEKAASTALERSLSNQGFVVVSGERAKEAELAIRGKASTYPFQSSGLGGFVSYRARLSVQAVRPGTQEVVVSISQEASGLGGNNDLAALKALETVGDLVGADLGAKLTEIWSKGNNVLIYVEGVKAFSDVERVRKHLQAQPGIADLSLRLYDENMAQFEVQMGSQRPAELAASLEASQSFPMKVVESTPQSLRLHLP
jgi:hypothetical protein